MILVLFNLFSDGLLQMNNCQISYFDFIQWVDKEQVGVVMIDGENVGIIMKDGQKYLIVCLMGEDIVGMLVVKGVDVWVECQQ